MRFELELTPSLYAALAAAAKHAGIPLPVKAAQLLELGLELEEDAYFAKIVKERSQKAGNFVSHRKAWK